MKIGARHRTKILAAICSLIVLAGMNVSAAENTKYADKLKSLGLFQGTENGYELDKTFTREESATMLVRLLGAEGEAETANYNPVFKDVETERWSYPYVMYCYENEITKGTAEDTFSPSDNISAEQYVCLMLRLLGYTDTEPENAFDTAVSRAMLSTDNIKSISSKEEFLRDDMVYISYNALKTKTANGEMFAYELADKGVITQSQAEKLDINKQAQSMNELIDLFME